MAAIIGPDISRGGRQAYGFIPGGEPDADTGPESAGTGAREPLTLIVCTRNRLSQLRACLACVLELRCRVPWQLVVVDNNSTDDTWQYLLSLNAGPGMTLECVRESRPGLSHARNLGIRHARGEVVAFTDDDCYPTASYLDDVLSVLSGGAIAYCGGRVVLHDLGDLPVSTRTATAAEQFPPRSFIAPGAICGANMAFRRELLQTVGRFDVRRGAGTAIGSAEDTDYLFRASWAGFAGLYSPGPTVRHHHGRRSSEDQACIEAAYARGRGAYYAKYLREPATRMVMLRNWYWRTTVRGAAGRERLRHELRGAALFLQAPRA
ncbi:MAG: glycosyltransferase family 2 protein [Proteobacteria bacterium]|nr:glycosyltransferase family 2 protein [Pseudomonadota bacterium]